MDPTGNDHAATVLLAEGCPSFRATYYRQRHERAAGSRLLRLRRPSAG